MSAHVAQHPTFTHLSVEIIQAGTDMIEHIGMLRGIARASASGSFKPYQMDDLRKAIKSASAAIAAYDYCTEASMAAPTNDEWRSVLATAEGARR